MGITLDLIYSEFLAEEIVRTLVGSLGLIAAISISTFIATAFIVYQDRLGEWCAFLESEAGDSGREHRHVPQFII
jgi:DMSO/TMAO reductase YedYZ heme-binding membrane subunit